MLQNTLNGPSETRVEPKNSNSTFCIFMHLALLQDFINPNKHKHFIIKFIYLFWVTTTRNKDFYITQGVTWKFYHVGHKTDVVTPDEESQELTTSVLDRCDRTHHVGLGHRSGKSFI